MEDIQEKIHTASNLANIHLTVQQKFILEERRLDLQEFRIKCNALKNPQTRDAIFHHHLTCIGPGLVRMTEEVWHLQQLSFNGLCLDIQIQEQLVKTHHLCLWILSNASHTQIIHNHIDSSLHIHKACVILFCASY
ncbi:hypothetical protein E2C01_000240 [Portunus trituberculatus]|uniref:Uncharacterized protein n=1 Tax=Portunus trituberculatus TaxID=210409 RepID=A0A5B7CGR2_PORTR|nr:hypothetical protein [Portunus trituberculatus]